MSTRSTDVWPGDVRPVRRQFEQWRRRRTRGTPIPEPLWRAAVALAHRHGVSKTSLALRLDYYSLKKRLKATARQRPVRAGDEGRFIELPLRAVSSGSVCVLEVEDNRGARLRLELQGVGAEELAGLVQSVWSQKP